MTNRNPDIHCKKCKVYLYSVWSSECEINGAKTKPLRRPEYCEACTKELEVAYAKVKELDE